MNRKIKLSLFGTLIAASALAITLPIVSCSSSTSEDGPSEEKPGEVTLNIANDEIKKNIENTITDSLNAKMQKDNISNSEQKALANTWKVGEEIHSEEKAAIDQIKDTIKFKDDKDKEFSYDDVVKNITFASSTTIGEVGTDITGPELKINFKDGYNGNVAIQVGSLGIVAPYNLSIDGNILSDVVTSITKSLKDEMDKAKTYEDQVAQAAKWENNKEIPDYAIDSIKDILEFKDENNEFTYDEVVESITFASETKIGNLDDPIVGPKLKINLKNGFVGDFTIQVGELGVVAPSKLLTTIKNDLDSTVVKLTTQFITGVDMDGKADRDAQIRSANIFSTNTEFPSGSGYYKTVIETLNFTNAQGTKIMGSDVIDKLIIAEGITIPATGRPIKGPVLKVTLKNGYTSNQDIIITVGNIGTAK